MKPITNSHCLKNGHFWKLRLKGWVCDHCRNFVRIPLDTAPGAFFKTKPDRWLWVKDTEGANV